MGGVGWGLDPQAPAWSWNKGWVSQWPGSGNHLRTGPASYPTKWLWPSNPAPMLFVNQGLFSLFVWTASTASPYHVGVFML